MCNMPSATEDVDMQDGHAEEEQDYETILLGNEKKLVVVSRIRARSGVLKPLKTDLVF